MAKPVRHRGKWRIRWTDENGHRCSETYDEYRDAQFKLSQHQARVEEIKRGLRAPTPPDRTFAELCEYWLDKRAPRKRSQKDDESIIRCHLRPAFGKLKLREITLDRIDDFVDDKDHLAKKTLCNLLTLLVTMLNVAKELGWVETLPRIKKPRVRLFNSQYRYLKTEGEIRRFLRAAEEEGETVYVLYATAIYTGMRACKLAALQWDDVDFEQRLIAVQRSFDGPTKGEDLRYVPLLDPLLPVLRRWRLKQPGKLVFTNAAGTMWRESGRVYQEILHRVLERARFPETVENGKTRRYITFHGLRHTFASHWMMRGGDIFKLQRILGHKSMDMTQRYAHLAPAAFAEDLGRLGASETLRSGASAPSELPEKLAIQARD